jgi:glutaredoxin-dependent peroxiredoxin
MSGVEFDVVDLPDADHVAAGEEAPDFTRPLVNAEYWEDTSLSDLTNEGPVVLVFTSMDGAFPATYAWNEIRERGWGKQGGPAPETTVVGLSISSPYEHKRTIEERGIEYRLFSDPANEVAEDYGIVNDLDGMVGVSEPRPAVFVIDADRVIQYAWVASEWPEFPEYDAVENALADL